MKKFLSAVMSLLLVALTGLLVYTVLNQDDTNFDRNNSLVSSVAPREVSSASAPPRSQSTTVQEVAPKDNESGQLPVLQTTAPASKNYSFHRQRSCFDSLPDSASRTVYETMLKTAYQVTANADDDGFYPTEPSTFKNQKLTEKQIRTAILALRSDNPQLFWIANRYSFSFRGKTTVVRLYSYVPPDECNEMIKKLNTAVSQIITSIPAGLDELDRQAYLFDEISKKTSYDDAAVTNTKLWLPHTAAGALVNGKAVCEGYSRSMQLLASYCSLDCRIVNGEGNGEPHMWNIVKINGGYYHFDPTWIDSETLNYGYFNVTDAIIRDDHKISANITTLTDEQVKNDGESADYNLTLPSCDDVQANYYRAKGIHIKDFSSDNNSAVISAVAAACKGRSDNILFYIEDDLDYQQTVQQMLKTSPYQLSYYIKKANQLLAGSVTINYNSIRYAEAEKSRGLTVIPSYQ